MNAVDLHEDAFVMDGLNAANHTEEYLTGTLPNAGVDAIGKTVAGGDAGFREAVDAIVAFQRRLERLPGAYQARTASDLRAQEGVAVVFGFQDTTPLGDDPDRVALFAQLGVRVLQLTYNRRNRSANGCTERVDGGLSRFGYEVIEAIEASNLVLDLSHVGPVSAREALAASTQPTVFSHSNPNAVHEHPRNVSDDLIRAAAETGGVVGVNAFPDFVGERPSIDDLVDHVEYLVDLVGADHVALGLDFIDGRPSDALGSFAEDPNYSDPPYTYPEGIESAADLPTLTAMLLERGFSETEIRKILGENLYRVFRSTWRE